jgi:hypothetical protein
MSRITWIKPSRDATSAMRSASSWASSKNKVSLSRKWWKIAPRDSPMVCSSLRTVALS